MDEKQQAGIRARIRWVVAWIEEDAPFWVKAIAICCAFAGAVFLFFATLYLLINLALAPAGRWICLNAFDCVNMNMQLCMRDGQYTRDECLAIALKGRAGQQ